MRADACFKLFGENIRYKADGEEKKGRLIRISLSPDSRMMVGIDENGFIEEYEIGDVNVIINDSGKRKLTKEIIKCVNKDIDSFVNDLPEYRKEEISECLEKIYDIDTKSIVLKILENKERLEDCGDLYRKIDDLELTKEEKDLLKGIIAYKQHDFDTAYGVFGKRWLENEKNLDACRDFILVAYESHNEVLCFYLLKYFFKTPDIHLGYRYYLNLWWKFLNYSIKYNNFDLLIDMEADEWNARVLIDSYIYVFHMFNMDHLAIGLTNQFWDGNNTMLQRNKEDFVDIDSAIDELNLCRNYIPQNAEGYYLRFEACVNWILGNGLFTAYDECDSSERKGYIYEYVRSRRYGFIIGYDLQDYFFHMDDVPVSVRKRIEENIYSDKDISEEEKIKVQFRCERVNSKIQAMDII